MTSIIIALLMCATSVSCVAILCNTALSITKIKEAGLDKGTLEEVQAKLDEEYANRSEDILTLNKVLEALDDEYGIEERDGR